MILNNTSLDKQLLIAKSFLIKGWSITVTANVWEKLTTWHDYTHRLVYHTDSEDPRSNVD